MRRRTYLLTSLGASLAIIILSACGSPATPAPQPTTAPPTTAPAAEAKATEAPTAEATAEVRETAEAGETEGAFEGPSNPGGPGEAVNLTGDVKAGEQIYLDKCKKCHGSEGKGGVKNEGSEDRTVPALNPLDEEFIDKDPKVMATRIDLYLEHGSDPEGTNPDKYMPAYGADKKLTPQQIADVIAYVMSLNKQ